jgi:Barstar (barnase inhibitor)
MFQHSHLYQSQPPWVVIRMLSGEDAKWLPSVLYGKENTAPVIRTLRGRKMKTYDGLMNEFGAALQFFDGFGENWNALSECLFYMDEWLPGEAYILVITNPQNMLIDEEQAELETFLRILNRVGDWWSRPIVDNGPYNRPAVPFHVILQATEEECEEVCQRYPAIPVLSR